MLSRTMGVKIDLFKQMCIKQDPDILVFTELLSFRNCEVVFRNIGHYFGDCVDSAERLHQCFNALFQHDHFQYQLIILLTPKVRFGATKAKFYYFREWRE